LNYQKKLYIKAACKIASNQAWLNDTLIFEKDGIEADAYLAELFRALSLNYPKWYKMDRLSQLGILASELLLKQSFDPELYLPSQLAIVLSNSHSSLDTDSRFAAQMDGIPSPAVFVYTLPNIVTGEISIRHKFKGEQAFFLTPEPDFQLLQQYVQTLFAEGHTKGCITGWIDSFRNRQEAILFLVTDSKTDSENFKEFSTENLYQYLHHEQGAVN
jgi:hypothetical protein